MKCPPLGKGKNQGGSLLCLEKGLDTHAQKTLFSLGTNGGKVERFAYGERGIPSKVLISGRSPERPPFEEGNHEAFHREGGRERKGGNRCRNHSGGGDKRLIWPRGKKGDTVAKNGKTKNTMYATNSRR